MARISTAERRTELVDAAVQVIATHGVDGATTRRIADAAGAPLATLHYCYESKELLFAAVFDRVAREYREVLARSDVHSDLATTARGLLQGVMAWYLESSAFASTIIELISWAQRQERKPATFVYNEAFAVMRRILGAANSDISVDAETIDEIAYAITSLSDGFALAWLTFGDRAESAAQAKITVGIFDAWLATKLGPTEQEGTTETVAEPPTVRSLMSWMSAG
ncbi:TetR/AcrR family transcriptional regulator [Nocardia sp. NPDC059091]|uniref:TetR/AcrR family transcriptional regulator n=1 Tax=Nocardia sp. NPDC059091 TaxID=3346724 RepID=UPI003676A3DC